MAILKGKTVFISGASRGIGKAIGMRLAREGSNIVIAAKTDTPHPKLPGTIHSAAEEMAAAGAQTLAVVMDIRQEEMVTAAVEQAVARFGGIDILINNASAISLTGTLATSMKRYDLMHQVNVRGTYMLSQKCLPHLQKSEHAHILNLSPPLNMEARWFQNHVAYTMTKFGMSMCVLGMAAEFAGQGISVNALWPKTTIATAAVAHLPGGEELMQCSRTTEIMGDAAFEIVRATPGTHTGQFFVDEAVLRAAGMTDFSHYAVNPEKELFPDFFL
ncbi:MAG: NAD(P)-dependent oxidoreductase [Bacteroidota bacterium]